MTQSDRGTKSPVTESALPAADRRRLLWRLAIISFASLFWEVLLIRWIPSELPFLAFFRSLVLLACFMGMGLGCIVYRRVRLGDGTMLLAFLTGILIVVGTIVAGGADLRGRGFGEHAGIIQQTGGAAARAAYESSGTQFSLEFEGAEAGGQIVVIGAFFLVTLIFVPIGILIARCFDVLAPIPAYLVNVVGALVGTGAFVGISFALLPPPYWFGPGLAAFALLGGLTWKTRGAWLILSAAVVGLVIYQGRAPDVIWSPYQRVSWNVTHANLPTAAGTEHFPLLGRVFVNYEYHQTFVNLGFIKNDEERLRLLLKEATDQIAERFDTPLGFDRRYNLPYDFCRPRNVLIIASGTGNEAAAALRHNVPEIDAVEIDPGIIEVGRRMHPEHPYDDPRVNVVCDDARAFLERTDKKYALIIMNAVDAHSQFASSAGLRLDSYIFTVEFFRQVRRHMADDGLFVMEFSGHHWRLPWSHDRLAEILWRAFHYVPPPESRLPFGAGGPMFFIPARVPPDPDLYNSAVSVSTDDWPQFYLQRPMIPFAYLELIAGVVAVCAAGLLAAWPKGMARVDWHFLLLGAAFMLLEIKSISELSLVFGATWLVNSIVIAAILAAIAAANLVVLRVGKVSYTWAYAIIFVSLAAGLVVAPSHFLALGYAARAVVGCLRVALPIFGAGLVFASSFRRAVLPPAALGWNLLGAMLGGLGEYLSLITGVQALGFGIIGLYVLSLAALRWSHLKA